MTALREIFAKYSVEFDDRQLQDGAEATETATEKLDDLDGITKKASQGIKALGGVIAGAFTIGAMRDMITSTLTATNEINRWGQRLQLNVGEVAAWSRIAEPFGADIEDVADAFKELQLKGQDALSGGTSQEEMFSRIGISLDDLRPVINDNGALMDMFVTKLDGVSDAGLRNFTVDELMSDAGTRMLPVFMQGADRLRKLREEMIAGTGATAKLAGRMGSWNTTTARVNSGLENLKATVVLAILPAMERMANAGAAIITNLQGMIEKSNIIQAALIVLTAAFITIATVTAPIWGPMALTVAGVAAAFFVLVAVIDDLITTLQGGDSITRRFIDGLFGEGSTIAGIRAMARAWNGLTGALENFGRVVAMTPGLNWLTGGLFEGGLDRSERQRAQTIRRAGGARTLSEAFSSDYTSRDERTRQQRIFRAEEQDEGVARDLGLAPSDFDPGEQSVWGGESSVASPNPRPVTLTSVPFRSTPHVDQTNRTTINVNGTADPRETAEMVREVIREENSTQLRQTQAALVPGSS